MRETQTQPSSRCCCLKCKRDNATCVLNAEEVWPGTARTALAAERFRRLLQDVVSAHRNIEQVKVARGFVQAKCDMALRTHERLGGNYRCQYEPLARQREGTVRVTEPKRFVRCGEHARRLESPASSRPIFDPS